MLKKYFKSLKVDAKFEIVNEDFPDKSISIVGKVMFVIKDNDSGQGHLLEKLSVISYFLFIYFCLKNNQKKLINRFF